MYIFITDLERGIYMANLIRAEREVLGHPPILSLIY